jgi:hypothetical protein
MMRGLVAICIAALAACATMQAADPIVDRAKSVWTNCGSRNAGVLARTRMAVNLAAYASIDACTDERRRFHDALRSVLGPGHDGQIQDAAERLRGETVRELVRWLTQERERMRREDLLTGPAQPDGRIGALR